MKWGIKKYLKKEQLQCFKLQLFLIVILENAIKIYKRVNCLHTWFFQTSIKLLFYSNIRNFPFFYKLYSVFTIL